MDHKNMNDEILPITLVMGYEDWREYYLVVMSYAIAPNGYLMQLGRWSAILVLGGFAFGSGQEYRWSMTRRKEED